jgi:hypothetical protein
MGSSMRDAAEVVRVPSVVGLVETAVVFLVGVVFGVAVLWQIARLRTEPDISLD